MSKTPVIIDCAPRCQNSMGLLLALTSDKLDVKGIVVPTFTQQANKATDNALRLVAFLGAKTHVIKGAATPLLGSTDNISYPKETGAGYRTLKDTSLKALDQNYIDYYYSTLMTADEKITLITMGPLTNVGALLLAYPDAAEKIESILVSGGTWLNGSPNIPGIAAEENILADPEAANIVFGAGVPLYLFGENLCGGLTFDCDDEKMIKSKASAVADFVGDILACHGSHHVRGQLQQSLLKSTCPVAYLINPSLFEIRNYAVTIDLSGDYTRGCTVVDNRFETGRTKFVPTHTHIAVKMDADGLKKRVLNL